MTEPAWVAEARKHIGLREIPGVTHSQVILNWWKQIKRGGIKADEIPWCAAFVGAMLESAGIVSSRFESAKSYLNWGRGLSEPVYGCVAVFARDGGGHVGFVVGSTASGDLVILGGNQGDEVNIRTFSRKRAAGYRWPSGLSIPEDGSLPVVVGMEKSHKES